MMPLPLAFLGITNWNSFLSGLLAFFALYLIISISLNLEMGYAGIPNFGKVLYFMGGAAFSGSVAIRAAAWIMHLPGDTVGLNNFLIAGKLTSMLRSDIPASLALIAITIAIGGLVGGILGYISIFPAIRLREDYLAMLLLGSAAFFQIFLSNYTPIINGTPRPSDQCLNLRSRGGRGKRARLRTRRFNGGFGRSIAVPRFPDSRLGALRLGAPPPM